jgi:hypothetical protein
MQDTLFSEMILMTMTQLIRLKHFKNPLCLILYMESYYLVVTNNYILTMINVLVTEDLILVISQHNFIFSKRRGSKWTQRKEKKLIKCGNEDDLLRTKDSEVVGMNLFEFTLCTFCAGLFDSIKSGWKIRLLKVVMTSQPSVILLKHL